MNEKTLRAQALVKQIEQSVAELNALLEDLDYTLLRAAGLQVRYAWGGCGSPWAGLGTKPIIPEREEHRRDLGTGDRSTFVLVPPSEARRDGRQVDAGHLLLEAGVLQRERHHLAHRG